MTTESPKPSDEAKAGTLLHPATCYTADVIQYKMPDGRKVPTSTKLPMDSREAYLDMQKHGCNFAAEMLMTGEISVTIEDPKNEVDVDIEVIPNGPDVQKGMVAMLNRGEWRKPYNDGTERQEMRR